MSDPEIIWGAAEQKLLVRADIGNMVDEVQSAVAALGLSLALSF